MPPVAKFRLVPDKFSLGDTRLLEMQSSLEANAESLSFFVAMIVFLSVACALCCYTVYVLDEDSATAVFVMLFFGGAVEILLSRNLIIFVMAVIVSHRG